MSATMSFILSVLFMTTALSDAQVLLGGECPNISVSIQKFDTMSFAGRWYEMIRTKRWVGTEIECVTHDLEVNSRFNLSYETNSYSIHLDRSFFEEGDAEVKMFQLDGSSTKAVMFDIEEYGTMNELVLLDTDYTSFAVLWSCATTDEDLHFENTMIWTRDKVPKAAALAKGLRALDNNNLTRNYLTYTRHRNCPDFHRAPEHDLGKESTSMPSSTLAAATTKLAEKTSAAQVQQTTVSAAAPNTMSSPPSTAAPVMMSKTSIDGATTKSDVTLGATQKETPPKVVSQNH